MNLKDSKVTALFSLVGLFSGILTILLGSANNYILWGGAGMIFLPWLTTGFLLAKKQGWLSLNPSLKRCVVAVLVTILSYPIAFLALLGGWFLHDWLYSSLRPAEWHQRTNSGDFDTGGFNTGLILAALTASVLIGSALSVFTRRWDKLVFAWMILLGLVTVPISIFAASIIGEPNWHLVLFPIGEMLFAALCGFWLLRSSQNNNQKKSVASTPIKIT